MDSLLCAASCSSEPVGFQPATQSAQHQRHPIPAVVSLSKSLAFVESSEQLQQPNCQRFRGDLGCHNGHSFHTGRCHQQHAQEREPTNKWRQQRQQHSARFVAFGTIASRDLICCYSISQQQQQRKQCQESAENTVETVAVSGGGVWDQVLLSAVPYCR